MMNSYVIELVEVYCGVLLLHTLEFLLPDLLPRLDWR
jgi:hypothetical protein